MANWRERARLKFAENLSRDAYAHVSQAAARPAETQVLQGLQTTRKEPAAVASPAGPCSACRGGQWWQLPGEAWHCRACEPDMPLEATSVTLPCHKVQTRPVRDPMRLRRMVEFACGRLTITPEALYEELKANGDLADLESGAVSVEGLRQVARTLAVMRAAL